MGCALLKSSLRSQLFARPASPGDFWPVSAPLSHVSAAVSVIRKVIRTTFISELLPSLVQQQKFSQNARGPTEGPVELQLEQIGLASLSRFFMLLFSDNQAVLLY